MERTPSLVSIKYIFLRIDYMTDGQAQAFINEVFGYGEQTASRTCRRWHIFHHLYAREAVPGVSYNNMPAWWRSLDWNNSRGLAR
jgi:hypothetical protein